MPLPSELARVDIVWKIESGGEIAVNTFWMQHVHHDTETFTWGDALQTIADKVATSMVANLNSSLGSISNTAHVDHIDAYQVGTDGRSTDKRTHVCAPTDIPGRASGGNILPPFLCAVVQTWGMVPGTFKSHPRRFRGRMFWPLTSDNALGADGLLTSSFQDGLRGEMQAFFNDMQGMHVSSGELTGGAADFMKMGVLSRVDQAFYQMEAVSVAKKPGVQRRRMNKLVVAQETPAAISHS